MFDTLGTKLQDTFQALRGQKQISEDNIHTAISQVRRSLLESDVSLKAVKLFTNRVQEKALGADVLRGVKPEEQFVKIINDELVLLLGGSTALRQEVTPEAEEQLDQDSLLEQAKLSARLNLDPSTTGSLLLLGLQGAGKTTTTAKLAYKLQTEGFKPLLVPCDLRRPAAITQLQILAKEAGVPCLDINPEDPGVATLLELAERAQAEAEEHGYNLLIYDTAGRLQVDTDLMAELLLLEKKTKPAEKLLVIDSLIGQEAANVAETFNTQIGVTGVILTKLDSDTRGGAALSIAEAIQKPIKFAAVGEKLEDLENFHVDRMASRILGMGDVLSLVEKAEAKIEEEEAKRLEAELMKGNFNYDTFMTAQNMLNSIGNFGSIFKMMGMGSMLSKMGIGAGDQDALLEQGQVRMAKFKIVINSMTKAERKQPELLDGHISSKARKERITKGSGMNSSDIDQLVAEFKKMRGVFKNLAPMLSMMQGQGADGASMGSGAASPMDMLSGMGGGAGNQAAAPDPMAMMAQMSGGMSRKQQKAMKMMGIGGAPKAKQKKAKKGTKPKIKGFDF